MIQVPTVFVLGAGASAPFGFPVGRTLLNDVCNIPLNPTIETCVCLTNIGNPRVELREFCDQLRYSGMFSVDAFLEHRTEFLRIGKLLIAATLIPHEDQERLFSADRDHVNWYKYLLARFNAPFERLPENRLSIITYNYDRSMEHFLYMALQRIHNKPAAELAEVMRSVPILHLHGSLGSLPWQSEAGRPYRPEITSESLQRAAESIRIIHEDVGRDPQFQTAHKLIAEADEIVFLGFGYDPTNLRRLIPDLNVLKEKRSVRGTCFGLREAEMYEIKARFPVIDLALSGWDTLSFLRERVVLR